jgi:DNA-directed RNA polymerase specialized sigma24 family protein
MSAPSPPTVLLSPRLSSDRELLQSLRRRDPGALPELIQRYQAFVHASASRRLDEPAAALQAAQIVFQVLARRSPRLPTKTALPRWLFNVTRLTCARARETARSAAPRRWPWRRSPPTSPTSPPPPMQRSLDRVIDGLRPRNRDEILRVLLGQPLEPTRRSQRALRAVVKGLQRRGVHTTNAELSALCVLEGAAPPADGLTEILLAEVASEPTGGSGSNAIGRRPTNPIARLVLRNLAMARWRRRLLVGVPSVVAVLALLVGSLLYWDAQNGFSHSISLFLVWQAKREGQIVPGMTQPARPWPPAGKSAGVDATRVHEAAQIYVSTNIWPVYLQFSPDQWDALEPRRIAPLPHFLRPDGTALLRNPEAQRGGLAGVLGFDFNWVSADFEIAGRRFTNVAARVKGNGTYLGSLHGDKRSFKVDLNRQVRGQKLAGADELNFHNLVNDYSCLSDALGYEFFREAGVPAPRTAFAYLSVGLNDGSPRKPLGLYVMVEPVDKDFALEHLNSRRAPLFKPITYDLFDYLGEDWSRYADIYDLTTEATPPQWQRLIEFARLVTQASDENFARQLGDFLDLDAFARFLACQVLLSNYDGLFSTGQNFYLYLDPSSNRFGFIPWDLDLSWGGFFLLGNVSQRERASIWHPWVGEHRFLARVLAVEDFRKRYRAQLEHLLATQFQAERLFRRIDALADVIREPVAAESAFRHRKFEVAVRDYSGNQEAEQVAEHERPAHQLKQFIVQRIRSVRKQLAGESDGVILKRTRR